MSASSPADGCATSASTATTTTTAASRTQSRSASIMLEQRQCDQCILLLQQVLEQSESKPAQLLRSMSASATATATATATNASYNTSSAHNNNSNSNSNSNSNTRIVSWRKTPNGIQVEIPVILSTKTTTNDSTSTASSRIIEADPTEGRNESAIETGTRLLRRITLSTRQWTSSVAPASTPAQRLAATSTRTNIHYDATSNEQDHPKPKTEWLSLQCRPCLNRGAESNARAFVMGPTPLSVVVCSNRLQQASQAEMAEIITHELMHIFDVRKLHLDLLHCPTLAYSEVRAAREAECAAVVDSATNATLSSSWLAPFTTSPGYTSVQHCVRQKATVATRNLFPERAQQCMDAVFEQAFADRRPFGNNRKNSNHPNNSSNNNNNESNNTKSI